MCATLVHRGNDGSGRFIDADNGVVLGHQRLSIIDLDGGSQPLHDLERRAYIVFNGEIYNYRELRHQLEQSGCRFHSDSDTEVILQAYLTWGNECVNRLRGMFAFAIWSVERKELFCARDRLGIKPFYYFWNGKHFIFASEIKALLIHPYVEKILDFGSVSAYLRFRYVPPPRTIFKNINKLPAAHVLTIHGATLDTKRFWGIPRVGIDQRNIRSNVQPALRKALSEAVNLHMISDVPLGAFLSGGVDSTVITALMSQFSNSSIKTHTASFSDSTLDEGPYAREAANYFMTDHWDQLVQTQVSEDFERIIYHLDEPLADASAVPTYYLCREARKRVTVCLSGDGGDELFAGYNWYGELSRLQRLGRVLPTRFSSFLSNALGTVMPETLRGAALIKNLGIPPILQHLNLIDCFSASELKKILRYQDKEYFSAELLFENVYSSIGSDSHDVVRSAQLVDLQTYMAEDILMKVDKMSMAHGLEVRVPMLDHYVVEQAMSIPSSFNLSGKQRKLLLKESMSDLVPGRFMDRSKHGFAAPVDQWLKNDLYELFGDLLLAPSTSNSGLFERGELLKIWQKFSGSSFHVGLSERLWTLFCFEMWNHVYRP